MASLDLSLKYVFFGTKDFLGSWRWLGIGFTINFGQNIFWRGETCEIPFNLNKDMI